MTTKERLHQLIEQLTEEDYATAERVLCALRDSAWESGESYSLDDAPWDDPLPDEVEAIREAKARIAAGERLIPHGEVMREIFARRTPAATAMD
jgi:hypothetical protein